MKALVYDIEIMKAVPPRDGNRLEGIEYCDGFGDHENCGISVMCTMELGRPWTFRVWPGPEAFGPLDRTTRLPCRSSSMSMLENSCDFRMQMIDSGMDHLTHRIVDFPTYAATFETFVSFNGIQFDNPVLECNQIRIPEDRCYDLLREIWIGMGLDPTKYRPSSHGGVGLAKMAEWNLPGQGKTGYGGDAPVWWQRREYVRVVEYCLQDVFITGLLCEQARHGSLSVRPGDAPQKVSIRSIDE